MPKISSGPHRGHASGNTDLEKKASQLVSDAKYEVNQELGKQSNLNPAQVAKRYEQRINSSPASPIVKSLAKKKLMGEVYTMDISDLVKESVSNTLNKVFVEGITLETEIQVQEESTNTSEKKYFVVITDKKTGNKYRRSATRAKIAELRANPNISSVEMTSYGKEEPIEKTTGAKTAKVKSGKGLKNDGNLANNYPPYDKVTRGDIIAGATGKDRMGGKKKIHKEEFLVSKKKNDAKDSGKVEGLKKGKKNKIKLFPDVSEQMASNQQKTINQSASKITDTEKIKQNNLADKIRNQESQILQRKLQALRSAPKGSDPSITASYQPDGDNIQEVAPPGFEGTIRGMKKHPELSRGKTSKGDEKNIYALAWWMKNKGYKSHKGVVQ